MLLEIAAAAQDYLASPPGLADQITAAGLSAWIIQKLKCWPQFKWVNQHTDQVNRIVSGVFAVGTTLGIHAIWQRTAETGGVLTISGIPTMEEALPMVWKAGGSFIMQEIIYRGFMKHEPGLQAADAVADVVADNKEKLAEVVARRDDTVLKLREPRQVASDVPLDFPWSQKPSTKDTP